MPAESISNSFEKKTAVFDKEFNSDKYLFVQEDTPLNNNISLCSIQVSAKQVKPITGLSRLGRREGSYVFASPKQFLEYIPSGNNRDKNYSIMTPGSCTLPNYYSETFVSKRISYIAGHDHQMGAVIIEIEDDDIFHFRQIQCEDDGSFIDMGKQYSHNKKTKRVPVNAIMGDIHGVQADEDAIGMFATLFATMDLRSLYLHDIFDGYSISHHIRDISEKSKRSEAEDGAGAGASEASTSKPIAPIPSTIALLGTLHYLVHNFTCVIISLHESDVDHVGLHFDQHHGIIIPLKF
jgi:hypothetical protein